MKNKNPKQTKHRNIYLTHWSVWFGANDEIHGWLVERLFTEALFDGTGYQENGQQADDNDETDQPATHCWLLTIKNSSAKVAVQIFTAFMWCFLSDQWGNTYIACHLPVVPIHILRTFALADNGSGVPIEPGGVWCEVQRIGRALSRYIYQVTNLWFGLFYGPMNTLNHACTRWSSLAEEQNRKGTESRSVSHFGWSWSPSM